MRTAPASRGNGTAMGGAILVVEDEPAIQELIAVNLEHAGHQVLRAASVPEAEALSERLYIVEEGRILFEGTSDEAKRQIGGTLRVSIEDGGGQRDLFRSFGHTVEEGTTISLITGPERIHEIMDLALRNGLSATVGPVTLEEAFLTIVGRSIDEE